MYRYVPKGKGFPNSFRLDRNEAQAAALVSELVACTEVEVVSHCTETLKGIWEDAERRKREILAEHPYIETEILMRQPKDGRRGIKDRRWFR